MNCSQNNRQLIPSTHDHTSPTHTHHKPSCCTLLPQTRSKLSHTQHTQCDIVLKWTVLRLLNWSVKNFQNMTYKETKRVIDK